VSPDSQRPNRYAPARFSLLPPLCQASIVRAVVVVILRIDLPHRLLARALFVGVRDQAGQTRDEEDGVAELVGEAEVGRDRRDGTVDVDRQRSIESLTVRVERAFGGANQ